MIHECYFPSPHPGGAADGAVAAGSVRGVGAGAHRPAAGAAGIREPASQSRPCRRRRRGNQHPTAVVAGEAVGAAGQAGAEGRGRGPHQAARTQPRRRVQLIRIGLGPASTSRKPNVHTPLFHPSSQRCLNIVGLCRRELLMEAVGWTCRMTLTPPDGGGGVDMPNDTHTPLPPPLG